MSLDSGTYLKVIGFNNDSNDDNAKKSTLTINDVPKINLNKLIMDTLRPLGYPVASMRYNNTDDTYIVFLEYNQASWLQADDEELATKHFFQVDIFSGGDYLQLVKDVKQAMKAAGFGRMFESETYDDDMKKYRKIIRFNYTTKIGGY